MAVCPLPTTTTKETKMSNSETEGPQVTVKSYAAHVEQLIRADFQEEPKRYADVLTWQDLADVCDANTYFEWADDHYGIESEFEFLNKVIDEVAGKFQWMKG